MPIIVARVDGSGAFINFTLQKLSYFVIINLKEMGMKKIKILILLGIVLFVFLYVRHKYVKDFVFCCFWFVFKQHKSF